jgi:hypothetical protein
MDDLEDLRRVTAALRGRLERAKMRCGFDYEARLRRVRELEELLAESFSRNDTELVRAALAELVLSKRSTEEIELAARALEDVDACWALCAESAGSGWRSEIEELHTRMAHALARAEEGT